MPDYIDETYPEFICKSCHVNTLYIDEYYMLKDEIWQQVSDTHEGMLCIGCVEAILGRKLNCNDFAAVPLNSLGDRDFGKSQRLRDRLQNFVEP